MKTVTTLAKVRQGRNDWYRIENNTEDSSVYIYDEIGYWGVTADDFVKDLNSNVAPGNALTVHVNSPGGNVFDGITILNALRARTGDVTTIVDGVAASAASFIVQAGTTRIMARNSEMMIHEASGMCIGNAADMREMISLLDRTSDNIASIYAERSGLGDVASWRTAMSAETWYSADEAVLAGLADSVDAGKSAQATDSWDLSIYAHASRKVAPPPVIPVAVASTFDLNLFKKGLRHGA